MGVTSTTTINRREVALAYHRLGINVVPTGADKRAAVGSWEEWQEERQTPETLLALQWERPEVCGLAAIAGYVSGYLVALDLDGAPGVNALEGLLARLGLPRHYEWAVRTPGKGGGWHVWVRSPGLAEALDKAGLKLKSKHEGPWAGADHIELRWNRCYTLLPPSKHPDGRYEWANGDQSIPEEPPAEVESRKLVRLTEWKKGERKEEAKAKSIDPAGYRAYVEKALEGEADALRHAGDHDRNNQLNRSAFAMGTLAHAGAEKDVVAGVLIPIARSIGLTESEIRSTFASGWDDGVAEPRQLPEPRKQREQEQVKPVDAPTQPEKSERVEEPTSEPTVIRHTVSWGSAEATVRCFDDISRRERGEIKGLPWPETWPELKKTLGPIEPGTFTVIAARPSVGKSMFASQLQGHLCDLGHRVYYVTRELTPERLVRRHVVAEGASMKRLRLGQLAQVDRDAMEKYRVRQRSWQVRYDHQSNTVADIAWEAQNFGAELVIVDYLQRMAYQTDKEYAAITRLVNEFQDFTLQTGIPLLLLSQLSRPVKGQDHKPPSMSDTRGSGAVEERATSLVLLHRNWQTEKQDQYGREVKVATLKLDTGMFIVAKNADGEADKGIPIRVDGSSMSIIETTDRYQS